MQALLMLLVAVGGLAVIAVGLIAVLQALDRRESGHVLAGKDVLRLKAENRALQALVSDVEQISSAAIATGDPIAHEMILERIRQTPRQPPAIEE